ncbi:hypothetical protein GCM10009610_54750 [Pseudonocardia xinjiangensis]
MSSERSEHDYVVVGAGSAGSVIIRRLLDHGQTVHVLESGPNAGCELVDSPGKWPELFGGRLDWAVTTVPQKHGADTAALCATRETPSEPTRAGSEGVRRLSQSR